MNVSYAEDIDGVKCQCPECKHTGATHKLWLKPACRPNAGMTVMYYEGMLVVNCRECAAPVAQIAVAKRPPELPIDEMPEKG